MIDTSRIADGLRQATDSGDVPGVVAAAATADDVIVNAD
jgi:methyl acetate hydrolase